MEKLNVCEICGKPIEGRQRKLCPECADICIYSDEQEKCEFYEKE